MSEEQGKPLKVVADEALEARIVSWVLGEAFEFEAEELQRLCNERPELEVFRRRMVAVHGLAGEGLKKPETDWKLPAAKRQKVLDVIGGRETRRERTSRFAARRVLLAAAACLGLTVIVTALVFPIFFGARAWKKDSPEAAARMDERNAHMTPRIVTSSARTDDDYGSAVLDDAVQNQAAKLEEKRKDLNREMEGRDAGLVMDNRRGGIDEDLSGPASTTTRGVASGEVARRSKSQEEKRKARVVTRDLMMKESEEALAEHSLRRRPVAPGKPAAPATRPARSSNFDSLAALVPPPAVAEPLAEHAESEPRGYVNNGKMVPLATKLPTERIVGTPARIALPGATGADSKPPGPPKVTAESASAPAAGSAIVSGNVESIDGDAFGIGGGSGGGPAGGAKDGERQVPMLDEVDAAWERALEAPEEEERQVAEKANKKVSGDREARERGKRRLNERAGLQFMEDEKAEPLSGEMNGEVLTERSKSPADSLGSESGFQRGGRQESAVQKLREDMAGDDGFGNVAEDGPALRFESRHLDVGADFLHRFRLADQNGDEGGAMDPFAEDSTDLSLLRRQTAGDVLLNYGFSLPEGSEVSFNAQDGKLFIKAPEDTVADLQELVDSLPESPGTDEAIDLMAEMSAQKEPFSTFSLHVSEASFRVAVAALERGERPDPEAVRPEEFYNAFDYGDPAPTAGEPVACAIEQCAHPLLPSRNLVRVGVRTAAAGRGAGQPLRLTVMLDNSGSMEREDRRAAVQAAMEQLASLLGPQDVVTVLGFARQPRLLCDRLSGEGVKAQLEGLVEKTPAEGGTNLEQALALADELAIRQFDAGAQNRIVLLTDGAANLGNADPEELAKRIEGLRQKGVSFDAAGFGTAGMNDRMLERLTRDGNGRYYVVDGPEDAGEQFAKKLAGAFRPAAENVKVQVRFNPARVGGYRLIGFEEHRLKKEDFRNDAVDAAEMASEEAGVAVYQVELLPDGEGEIGEVSVRFRDTSKGRMVERSWTMPHDESAPGFDRAPASMQVAGLAVLAADALRDGPLAPLTDWGELAPVSNRVRAEFGGSEKVGQLLQMVERLR